jgi:flagellar biogenesis protein FliO
MGYQTGHEWFLGNPFGELAYDRQWKDFMTVSAVFASLLFVISVPWLFKQMRQFKPDKNINPAQKPQP